MAKINTLNYQTLASWNGSQDLFVVEQPDGTKVATPAMVKQFIEAGNFIATGEVGDGHGNMLKNMAKTIEVKPLAEAGDFEATGEVKDGHGNILDGLAGQISQLDDETDALWGRSKPTIAANTDLNTLQFTAVGEYTTNGNNKNIQNVPTEIKNVSFWLKTINILTNETTEINAAWKIRAQIIIPVGISAIYIRQISSGSSASSITYEPWKKITLSNA